MGITQGTYAEIRQLPILQYWHRARELESHLATSMAAAPLKLCAFCVAHTQNLL